ncbi:hypothetical protein GMD78_08045 [Ornithinibacillus sp. L9]|uniref:Uncharacterized protein n=1 Tax=Ornithinibacillus caprae TaxID=2678566 RepID=A0A6N8FLZ6_9BACI|nr:hypothetical protein [Ornithinibacillus caprae]MUK88338.1 hypothetical protein [Ornithinibacillus caprae]
MGKQIRGLLYYYLTDIQHSIKIFWSILLSVLVVCIVFAYFLLSVEDGFMRFGFPFAIYVYFMILGFLTVKESIPFALKLGATRKNIFISIGIFFLILVFAYAIVANTLQEITLAFTKAIGIDSFAFLHLAQLIEDTWLNRVIIDTSLMFLFSSVMFIIGLLFYRYGLAGGGSVVAVLAIAMLLAIAKGWIFDFISHLVNNLDLTLFYQILLIGIVIYCISFLLIQTITINKAR